VELSEAMEVAAEKLDSLMPDDDRWPLERRLSALDAREQLLHPHTELSRLIERSLTSS